MVLGMISAEDDPFMVAHGHPALRRLTGQLRRDATARRILQWGVVPVDPEVSIVIPVFGTLDLVAPQIALLADDSEIREAEIILVLDSPELEAAFASLLRDLSSLYGMPMQGIVMNQNAGFGIASNLGAEHARGALLLLLNSDVFPASPGWLSRMVTAYRSREGLGALGPKLLFEDGSLQHAGMFFDRDPETGRWYNQHFYKGLSSRTMPSQVTRTVPAVTGACMLVNRDLFLRTGGFDPIYVVGEYEDSDLCLRLAEAGYESRYLADVSLYHLERQSFDSSRARQREAATRHNAWLQTQRWGTQIELLMRAYDSPDGVEPFTASPSPATTAPTHARKGP